MPSGEVIHENAKGQGVRARAVSDKWFWKGLITGSGRVFEEHVPGNRQWGV